MNYSVDISNSIATVQLEQTYKNNFESNIETEFFFSISDKSAFVKLEAHLENKIIKGNP